MFSFNSALHLFYGLGNLVLAVSEKLKLPFSSNKLKQFEKNRVVAGTFGFKLATRKRAKNRRQSHDVT